MRIHLLFKATPQITGPTPTLNLVPNPGTDPLNVDPSAAQDLQFLLGTVDPEDGPILNALLLNLSMTFESVDSSLFKITVKDSRAKQNLIDTINNQWADKSLEHPPVIEVTSRAKKSAKFEALVK